MAITFKDKLSPCLSVIVDSQPCGQTDYKARRHVTGDTLLQEHLSLCYYLFKRFRNILVSDKIQHFCLSISHGLPDNCTGLNWLMLQQTLP